MTIEISRPLGRIQIFTDGACSGNPGPGGWGVLMRWGEIEKEISGGEINTTNNRMELMAAIKGLEALNKRGQIDLYTDCLLYTSPSPRDGLLSRMPSSA